MKKKLAFIFLVLLNQMVFCQTEILTQKLEKIALERSKEDKNSEHIKNFFKAFNTAKSVESSDLISDYVGICINIPAQNNSISVIPAKYSVSLDKKYSLIPILDNKDVNKKEQFIEKFTNQKTDLATDTYYTSLKYVDSEYGGSFQNVKEDWFLDDSESISILKSEGDEQRMMLSALRRFTKYTNTPNVVALTEKIAAHFVEKGGY